MPQPQVCLNHSLLVSGGAVPPPALRWNLAVSNLTHKRGCRREYTNAQYAAQPTFFKGQVHSNTECNFQVSNKMKAASGEMVDFFVNFFARTVVTLMRSRWCWSGSNWLLPVTRWVSHYHSFIWLHKFWNCSVEYVFSPESLLNGNSTILWPVNPKFSNYENTSNIKKSRHLKSKSVTPNLWRLTTAVQLK